MHAKLKTIAGLTLIFLFFLFIVEATGAEKTISKFTEENSALLVLFALISVTILLYDFLTYITTHIRDGIYDKIHFKEFSKKLTRLGPNEKYILSLFIDSKHTTHPLDPNDSSVSYLESSRIIFKTQEKKDDRFQIYRLSPVAVHILTRNPNWLR